MIQDQPTTDLPTITIVDMGSIYAILADFDDNRQPGIVGYYISIEKAVDEAVLFLIQIQASAGTHIPPFIRLASPRPPTVQVRVALSDEAWANLQRDVRIYGYQGRATHMGTSAYLLALVKANPAPTDWYDDRASDPDALNEYDVDRLSENQFPLWSRTAVMSTASNYGHNRTSRGFNAETMNRIWPNLEAIATHFMITPYERGSGSPLNPRHRAYATIEAIGLGLLKYRNEPPFCSAPIKHNRRGHRRSNPSGIIF